jgi:hypothetical protein
MFKINSWKIKCEHAASRSGRAFGAAGVCCDIKANLCCYMIVFNHVGIFTMMKKYIILSFCMTGLQHLFDRSLELFKIEYFLSELTKYKSYFADEVFNFEPVIHRRRPQPVRSKAVAAVGNRKLRVY